MKKMLMVLGVAAAANFGGAAAMAEPAQRPVVVIAEPEPVVTRRVSYADLDLTGGAGERTLIRRVRAAVKQVCAIEMGPSAQFYAEYSCRKLTWRDTEPLIGRAVDHARQMAGNGAPNVATAVILVRAGK